MVAALRLKRSAARFLAIATLLAAPAILATHADGADQSAKFIMNTEAYPPYQFKNSKGVIDGENVKVVRELCKRGGLNCEIKMDSWEKSLAAAKRNDDQGVFTAIRNQERESQFQWVGPISVTRWVFLAKQSKGIKITDVKDAFKYKIGGYKHDAKSEYLEKLGAKVDKVEDDAANAKRLEKGEIDLWATGYVSGMQHAKEQGFKDIEEVFAYREDFGYLALNSGTKASMVLNLNRIVEEMKDQGLIKAKFKAPK